MSQMTIYMSKLIKKEIKDLTLYLPFFIMAALITDFIFLKPFFPENSQIYSFILVLLVYLLLFTFVWKLSLSFKKRTRKVTLSILLSLNIPLFVYVVNLGITDFNKNINSIIYYSMFILIFGWFIINSIISNKNISRNVIYSEIAINSAAASITMLAVQSEILKTSLIESLKIWQFDFMIVIFAISVGFAGKLTSRHKDN